LSQAENSEIRAAYADQDKPAVAVVLYDAKNSIIIAPSFTPLVQVDTTVSGDASVKAGEREASGHIEGQRTSTVSVANESTATQHQLFSWSDIQQAVFETLRGHGIRLVDPEIVTLSSLDKLLVRTQQGISLHTAELETVRKADDFQVLMLVQEVREGNDTYLQGRVWDLRDGTFLAASRARLLVDPAGRGGKILLQGRTRSMTEDLLAQAATTWDSL